MNSWVLSRFSHYLLCSYPHPSWFHPRVRKSTELLIGYPHWFIYELIMKWNTKQHSQLKSSRSGLPSHVNIPFSWAYFPRLLLLWYIVAVKACLLLPACTPETCYSVPLQLSNSEFSSFVYSSSASPFFFSSVCTCWTLYACKSLGQSSYHFHLSYCIYFQRRLVKRKQNALWSFFIWLWYGKLT